MEQFGRAESKKKISHHMNTTLESRWTKVNINYSFQLHFSTRTKISSTVCEQNIAGTSSTNYLQGANPEVEQLSLAFLFYFLAFSFWVSNHNYELQPLFATRKSLYGKIKNLLLCLKFKSCSGIDSMYHFYCLCTKEHINFLK